MQAHPLSSPAARIKSSSLPASRRLAHTAGKSVSPHLPIHPKPVMAPGLYVGVTSGLAAQLSSAFAMSKVKPVSTIETSPSTFSLAEGAGLAHDAGNLLGALGLYCDLLQAPGVLRPEHLHYAAELRQLAGRSGAMIQRLLRANLPQAQQEAAPQCNPAKVLAEQVPLLAGVAGPWSAVRVEVQPGLTCAPVPQETLERVTLNLVRNAAQAMQKQHENKLAGTLSPGCILVTFSQVKQHMELRVEDDGPGLTPALAAAFLHPTPLPLGAESGLGHRIVHELVQRSGGQIAIRVRPGRGTLFTITWPGPEDMSTVEHSDECISMLMGGVRGGSSAC